MDEDNYLSPLNLFRRTVDFRLFEAKVGKNKSDFQRLLYLKTSQFELPCHRFFIQYLFKTVLVFPTKASDSVFYKERVAYSLVRAIKTDKYLFFSYSGAVEPIEVNFILLYFCFAKKLLCHFGVVFIRFLSSE